jgi:hypothetical protein
VICHVQITRVFFHVRETDMAARLMARAAASVATTAAATDKQYLTSAEVGRLLRVDRATVRLWAKRGYIPPPVRIGYKLLFDSQKLMTAVEQSATAKA